MRDYKEKTGEFGELKSRSQIFIHQLAIAIYLAIYFNNHFSYTFS